MGHLWLRAQRGQPPRDAAHVDTQVMTEEASHPGARASAGTLPTCAAWGSRLLQAPAWPCVSLTPRRASLFWVAPYKLSLFNNSEPSWYRIALKNLFIDCLLHHLARGCPSQTTRRPREQHTLGVDRTRPGAGKPRLLPHRVGLLEFLASATRHGPWRAGRGRVAGHRWAEPQKGRMPVGAAEHCGIWWTSRAGRLWGSRRRTPQEPSSCSGTHALLF